MNKKTIICVVGPSGSGKTTMGMSLCEKEGYNWICSYTTRSMREDETNGVEHWFVGKSDIPRRADMFACGVFGDDFYWAKNEQFIEDVPNVYVIDEKSLLELEKNLLVNNNIGMYSLVKVYVKRDSIDVDDNRMRRDNDRKKLPESFYDIILENNGDIDEFLSVSADKIKKTIDLKK